MILRYTWATSANGDVPPTSTFGVPSAQAHTLSVSGGKLRLAVSSNSGGHCLMPSRNRGQGELRGRVTLSHTSTLTMVIQFGADMSIAEAYGGYFNAPGAFYVNTSGSVLALRDTGPSLTQTTAFGVAWSSGVPYDFVFRRVGNAYQGVMWLTGTQRPAWMIDTVTANPDSFATTNNSYIAITIDGGVVRSLDFDYLEYDDLRPIRR